MKKLLIAVLIVALVAPMLATPVLADTTYVVQPGDNLYRIGLKFGVTVAALKAANGLQSDTIYVGQRLTGPGGSGGPRAPPPPAPRGATLFRIGLRFGVTVAAIKAANGLTSDIIYVAQRLTIPGTSGAPAPTP